jgi:alkanesulfonate monooxygenase SsuD/methylene tetrahydromethanopterin reductase-like flavin-dependent oxidoreductase (luciferase family)
MHLALRYDMRAPAFGAPTPALYAASIEQSHWADRLGFDTVYLAEHHGAEDGYCASPMIQASAIAAVTARMEIHLSALIAVLHHPLRLAEDLATVDIISQGRLAMTLGIGYRPHEYVMFGVQKSRRVPLLEEIIGVLDKAWSGEPFEYRGTTVMVRPTPVQKPRPPIYIGGSSEASAIRAARLGDNYLPAVPALTGLYEAELRRLGRPIPPRPLRKGPLFLFVTDDPEQDWQVVAPHVIYTSNSNAEWARERGVGATPYPPVSDVADLKASPEFAVVTPDECVKLAVELGPESELVFQPLMGGLDPEVGWRSLEMFEAQVLPRLIELDLREDRMDRSTDRSRTDRTDPAGGRS